MNGLSILSIGKYCPRDSVAIGLKGINYNYTNRSLSSNNTYKCCEEAYFLMKCVDLSWLFILAKLVVLLKTKNRLSMRNSKII